MPEAERLETLALLQQNRQEVEAKLQALPLRIETHSMVSRRLGRVGGEYTRHTHRPGACPECTNFLHLTAYVATFEWRGTALRSSQTA
jgi:hypothetical protein